VQTVSQATEIVSHVLGLPRNRVVQAARVLLNADLLPKSVGRDVKRIDGGGLLLLIAGSAMAERSVDAAKVAKEFGELPLQTGGADGEGQSLRELFAAAMDPEKGWSRTSLELSRTAAGVTATIDTAIRNETHEIEVTLPFWRSESWGGWAKTSFSISPSGLEIMRNLFKREDADEMSFALNPDAVEA
jgi:hypothetical protein